ncbi:Oxidoreductase, molybdopterin-binding domain-containing protein [Chytridium lagenaria]|nr:Oxidoreductase, molybdopterin-binding domain-containing protein [Chytridium lagenaria]
MFGSSQLVPRDAAGLPKSGPGSKDSLKKRTSSGLPYYSRDEVRSHTSKETGIWVTRGDAVYDITQFVDVHPGGEKILLAAGQSIDPFWNIFSIHQSDSTRELLEQYRIGDLVPLNEDTSAVSDAEATVLALAKLFENDPKRHSSLIVRSARPCNAESPAEALSTFTTPNDVFYVRNHLPVPKIDPEEFCLEIDLPGLPERSFTLQELKEKFPKVTVMATLQCAGNRRFEMHAAKPVKGLLWQRGAIGNATWSGVMLSDVLKYAAKEAAESEGKTVDSVLKNGYSNELAGRPEGVLIQAGQDLETVGVACKHVHFEGAEGYGASIPLSKAISEEGDVLLAYEMNGEPLPADHGFPLRSIVPGHVAARSVKWLKKISVSDEESHSHWQRKDYKGFGPSKTLETSKYEASESIQEMPVQSAVLSPKEGDVVKIADTVAVEGYAWSGGGRGIVRVDVSADGGKTWHDATVLKKPGQPRGREWAWTRWEASEIVCKAVDTSYNEQPERMESVYNVRGVLVSAWHRVKVEAKKAEDNKP